MMKPLTVNRTFAVRHLAVTALFLALSGWFAFDGFVVYPKTSAPELYARIHAGEKAPDEAAAAIFKVRAVERQRQYAAILLIAALWVAAVLAKAKWFRFAYDETGFEYGGRRYAWSELKAVDARRWAKKGIIAFTAGVHRVTLDAWHHAGVDDLVKMAGLAERETK